MSKAKCVGLGIGVFFLIVIIISILLYYSHSQINVELNDVSYHSIDWADFTFLTLIKLGLNAISGNWLNAKKNTSAIDGKGSISRKYRK